MLESFQCAGDGLLVGFGIAGCPKGSAHEMRNPLPMKLRTTLSGSAARARSASIAFAAAARSGAVSSSVPSRSSSAARKLLPHP